MRICCAVYCNKWWVNMFERRRVPGVNNFRRRGNPLTGGFVKAEQRLRRSSVFIDLRVDVTQRGSDSDVILQERQPASQLQDSGSIAPCICIGILEAGICPQTARQVHKDYADNTPAQRPQVQGAA
jgi:hypothetical protein